MSAQSLGPVPPSVPAVMSAELPVSGPRYRAALEGLRPLLLAMPPDQCGAAINNDIPTMVSTVMGGVVARIFRYREQLAQLPWFDMALVERMEEILMALASAQAQYVAAYGPAPELQQRYDDALEHLQQLLAEIQPAVRRGLMSGEQLKELRGASGYRNVAFDLLAVTQMLRAILPKLAGRTSQAELDAAETAAEKLNEAIGLREAAPAAIQEAADIRHRAYNMFRNCYDEAQRGLTFLRWRHGDLDSIAPSLFAGRGGRKKEKAPVEAEPAVGGLGGDPMEDAE